MGLGPKYRDVSYPLRQRITPKMLRFLVDEIPRYRILYQDRYHPTPYHFNVVESQEFVKYHPDGNPLPHSIQAIRIHKIFKFHGNSVKIWEVLPRQITASTPVCLIPGFGSNYYSFHFEGNDSIDYYLAQAGSHVFVLDHDRKDPNANVDVFTEYLTTTMIDFVRERTGCPQVILGGHSMGGMIAIFKAILDAVRRPRFNTTIKALIILNAPIHFDADYYVSEWVIKLLEFSFEIFGHEGTVPFVELVRLLRKIPFSDQLFCMDRTDFLKRLQRTPLLEYNPYLQQLIDFQVNPFTKDIRSLKQLANRAIANPPRMVVQHLGRHVKRHLEGISSYNYEVQHPLLYDTLEGVSVPSNKKGQGIHYTENIYRISAAIPLLAIQVKDDLISPPRSFYKYWGRWAQRYKMRLDSIPNDPEHQQRVYQDMKKFIREHGLSTAIGVTVSEGRHMGALQSEKELIQIFINQIEQINASPSQVVEAELIARNYFFEQETNEMFCFIAEQDLAKKIRFLDIKLLWKEKNKAIAILLDLLLGFNAKVLKGESYRDFSQRKIKPPADQEQIQYHVLQNCVTAILSFEPDAVELLKVLQKYVASAQLSSQAPRICALLDVALGLFMKNQTASPPLEVLKEFHKLVSLSIQSHEPTVVLHTLRVLFRSRDSGLIAKAGGYCKKLPDHLKDQAYSIYWGEIRNHIHLLSQVEQSHLTLQMEPFMKIARQQTKQTH